MRWELAVAVCDEPEAHRKKEGDVIAYMPAPHEWGGKETNEYLIIPFEGTEEEVRELCEPRFYGGKKMKDHGEKPPKTIAKRRHHFDFSKFEDVDLDRIRDKEDHYQPFKENKTTFKKDLIKDKHTNKFIK